MKSQKKKNTVLSQKEASNRKKDWRDCLPGDLSNLFYYPNEDGVHRFNNYFALGKDGIAKLLKLGTAINYIRVYMGCKDNKFSPLFTIVSGPKGKMKEDSYSLQYVPKPQPINQPLPTLDEITPGIAELFQANWEELSDVEVADAFSGVTAKNIKSQTSQLQTTHRVKFYDFPHDDVQQIIHNLNKIKQPKQRYVRLLLGAGLKVRLTHPFNFRPILSVPSHTQQQAPVMSKADETYETYFERSKPCPPFCDDDGGS